MDYCGLIGQWFYSLGGTVGGNVEFVMFRKAQLNRVEDLYRRRLRVAHLGK